MLEHLWKYHPDLQPSIIHLQEMQARPEAVLYGVNGDLRRTAFALEIYEHSRDSKAPVVKGKRPFSEWVRVQTLSNRRVLDPIFASDIQRAFMGVFATNPNKLSPYLQEFIADHIEKKGEQAVIVFLYNACLTIDRSPEIAPQGAFREVVLSLLAERLALDIKHFSSAEEFYDLLNQWFHLNYFFKYPERGLASSPYWSLPLENCFLPIPENPLACAERSPFCLNDIDDLEGKLISTFTAIDEHFFGSLFTVKNILSNAELRDENLKTAILKQNLAFLEEIVVLDPESSLARGGILRIYQTVLVTSPQLAEELGLPHLITQMGLRLRQGDYQGRGRLPCSLQGEGDPSALLSLCRASKGGDAIALLNDQDYCTEVFTQESLAARFFQTKLLQEPVYDAVARSIASFAVKAFIVLEDVDPRYCLDLLPLEEQDPGDISSFAASLATLSADDALFGDWHVFLPDLIILWARSSATHVSEKAFASFFTEAIKASEEPEWISYLLQRFDRAKQAKLFTSPEIEQELLLIAFARCVNVKMDDLALDLWKELLSKNAYSGSSPLFVTAALTLLGRGDSCLKELIAIADECTFLTSHFDTVMEWVESRPERSLYIKLAGKIARQVPPENSEAYFTVMFQYADELALSQVWSDAVTEGYFNGDVNAEKCDLFFKGLRSCKISSNLCSEELVAKINLIKTETIWLREDLQGYKFAALLDLSQAFNIDFIWDEIAAMDIALVGNRAEKTLKQSVIKALEETYCIEEERKLFSRILEIIFRHANKELIIDKVYNHINTLSKPDRIKTLMQLTKQKSMNLLALGQALLFREKVVQIDFDAYLTVQSQLVMTYTTMKEFSEAYTCLKVCEDLPITVRNRHSKFFSACVRFLEAYSLDRESILDIYSLANDFRNLSACNQAHLLLFIQAILKTERVEDLTHATTIMQEQLNPTHTIRARQQILAVYATGVGEADAMRDLLRGLRQSPETLKLWCFAAQYYIHTKKAKDLNRAKVLCITLYQQYGSQNLIEECSFDCMEAAINRAANHVVSFADRGAREYCMDALFKWVFPLMNAVQEHRPETAQQFVNLSRWIIEKMLQVDSQDFVDFGWKLYAQHLRAFEALAPREHRLLYLNTARFYLERHIRKPQQSTLLNAIQHLESAQDAGIFTSMKEMKSLFQCYLDLQKVIISYDDPDILMAFERQFFARQSGMYHHMRDEFVRCTWELVQSYGKIAQGELNGQSEQELAVENAVTRMLDLLAHSRPQPAFGTTFGKNAYFDTYQETALVVMQSNSLAFLESFIERFKIDCECFVTTHPEKYTQVLDTCETHRLALIEKDKVLIRAIPSSLTEAHPVGKMKTLELLLDRLENLQSLGHIWNAEQCETVVSIVDSTLLNILKSREINALTLVESALIDLVKLGLYDDTRAFEQYLNLLRTFANLKVAGAVSYPILLACSVGREALLDSISPQIRGEGSAHVIAICHKCLGFEASEGHDTLASRLAVLIDSPGEEEPFNAIFDECMTINSKMTLLLSWWMVQNAKTWTGRSEASKTLLTAFIAKESLIGSVCEMIRIYQHCKFLSKVELKACKVEAFHSMLMIGDWNILESAASQLRGLAEDKVLSVEEAKELSEVFFAAAFELYRRKSIPSPNHFVITVESTMKVLRDQLLIIDPISEMELQMMRLVKYGASNDNMLLSECFKIFFSYHGDYLKMHPQLTKQRIELLLKALLSPKELSIYPGVIEGVLPFLVALSTEKIFQNITNNETHTYTMVSALFQDVLAKCISTNLALTVPTEADSRLHLASTPDLLAQFEEVILEKEGDLSATHKHFSSSEDHRVLLEWPIGSFYADRMPHLASFSARLLDQAETMKVFQGGSELTHARWLWGILSDILIMAKISKVDFNLQQMALIKYGTHREFLKAFLPVDEISSHEKSLCQLTYDYYLSNQGTEHSEALIRISLDMRLLGLDSLGHLWSQVREGGDRERLFSLVSFVAKVAKIAQLDEALHSMSLEMYRTHQDILREAAAIDILKETLTDAIFKYCHDFPSLICAPRANNLISLGLQTNLISEEQGPLLAAVVSGRVQRCISVLSARHSVSIT